MKKIPDCIIAAAGRSSRMKSWKPGLAWGGSTVLETVVDTALEAGCRVIVVGGYRFRLTSGLMAGRENVTVVRARRWRKGMDESIRRGIREVQGNRFFVVPGDMPLIAASDYRRLAEAGGGEVVRPVRNGQPGHPVLFGAESASAVMRGRSGTPLRQLLGALKVLLVEWDRDGVVVDIDTPEVYGKYRPGD